MYFFSPLVPARDIKGSVSRPEQKVKPLSVSNSTPRPPVGTVQPTTRALNPPEITPPPSFPAVPMKRTPTPERIRKISQSPDTPKKEVTVSPLVDNVKKDQNVVPESKPINEIPVATASVASSTVSTAPDENKANDSIASVDETQKVSPSRSSSADRSVKLSTPDTATKDTASAQPSTSKPKRYDKIFIFIKTLYMLK